MNLIENQSDENTLLQLAKQLEGDLQTKKQLIIDLRNNMGGNNGLYQPIIDVISADQSLKLFVFTSRKTFSAGINFLEDLKRSTNAVIIGEPPGAGYTHHGDAQFYMLPNSGIMFMSSSKTWNRYGKEYQDLIEPDIKIEFNYDQYRNGVDPWITKISELNR